VSLIVKQQVIGAAAARESGTDIFWKYHVQYAAIATDESRPLYT
jgi:hypothetical protein